ncbi:aminomethyltransferase family protein [Natronomonas sp. EA1]|uniref:CAF17-like 4Fe-4S cluster assembly/insertion protein YgfZ n=1 Tax=Natronomonas sp. EA1 TaxID=3421655 RepID=UPI003EBB2F43
MTVVGTMHEDHGATFTEYDGRRVVDHYGRPERTHRAVRNAVGVIEMGYGIVEVTGADRVDFVDNALTNDVPTEDGQGVYALLLDAQGGIRTDCYVYNAGERLLCFTPPANAGWLAEEWAEHTFIQDVEVAEASERFGVFGVHGPKATEKVASVLHKIGTPDGALNFDRGSMGEAGVTVIRGDDPTGDEAYEIICAADHGEEVFDTLLTRGLNAVPFGYATWNTLTLEAGTPLFSSELKGRVPNVAGLRNALDFEKGCYVGQEVVSRVENQGRPSKRLVGLRPDAVPEAGAAVFDGDATIGEVTRAADCPSLDGPAALAYVDFTNDAEALTVRVDGDEVEATRVPLPFYEGSAASKRLPTYPEA